MLTRQAACRMTAFLLATGLGAGAPARGSSIENLRRHVEYLAHDALGGRGIGTMGLVAAGSYVAARFEEAGLVPGGDNDTYFQGFEVTTAVTLVGENRLHLGGRALSLDDEWRPHPFSASDSASAAVVFAGYGITAPEYDWDDYAGIDVKGKVVLVLALEPGQLSGAPAGNGGAASANSSAGGGQAFVSSAPNDFFAGMSVTAHSDLHTKAINAREHGAAGMLLVIGPISGVEDRLAPLRAEGGVHPARILCAQVRAAALRAALPAVDLEALQRGIESTKRPASQALDAAVRWSTRLEEVRSPARNVIAVLPGLDLHRAIVIGAHYDHLGLGSASSLAPEAREPHNGADDNASGTAALLEIARTFAARGRKPPQPLVFAAVSAAETGLGGSDRSVDAPVLPLTATSAMLNMDMVGRLRDRKLTVLGAASATEFKTLLDSLNTAGPRFDLRATGDGYGPSDQMSFFKKGIPVLHFFTGTHSDYHKPSDDADRLDYAGLAEVAAFVVQVADAVARQPLHFVGATQPAGDTGVGSFRSYLGTIPDYGQPEDLKGVLLSGVRDGSPAAAAGLRGGDVIVRIDDMEIQNIYDYVHVLRTRSPGEQVRITVLRDAAPITLPTTLGAPRGR